MHHQRWVGRAAERCLDATSSAGGEPPPPGTPVSMRWQGPDTVCVGRTPTSVRWKKYTEKLCNGFFKMKKKTGSRLPRLRMSSSSAIDCKHDKITATNEKKHEVSAAGWQTLADGKSRSKKEKESVVHRKEKQQKKRPRTYPGAKKKVHMSDVAVSLHRKTVKSPKTSIEICRVRQIPDTIQEQHSLSGCGCLDITGVGD